MTNPPLRILLVDDEAPALLRMQSLLADIAAQIPSEVVASVAQAQAAFDCLQKCQVDVVLLDIQMPGMSGLELARHLQRISQQLQHPLPALIFITAYDQHALEAFELHAVDYLLKPVRAARLLDALQRVQQRQLQQLAHPLPTVAWQTIRQHLTIHQRGKFLLVPITEVIHFKAELKYVTVRTQQAEYLLEESLLALEEEFTQQFIRVHRNALVARTAIAGFIKVKPAQASNADEKTADGHWEVLLTGISERLPISRRQWPLVKELVKNH